MLKRSTLQINDYAIAISLLFLTTSCIPHPKVTYIDSGINSIKGTVEKIDENHWKAIIVLPNAGQNSKWEVSSINESLELEFDPSDQNKLIWRFSKERWMKGGPFVFKISNPDYSGTLKVSIGGSLGAVGDTTASIIGAILSTVR